MEIRSGQVQPSKQMPDMQERDRYAVGQRSRLSLRLGHQIVPSTSGQVGNSGWSQTPSTITSCNHDDEVVPKVPKISGYYDEGTNVEQSAIAIDNNVFIDRFQKLKDQYEESPSSTPVVSPRTVELVTAPRNHLQLTESIRCSSARPNASPIPGGRDLMDSPLTGDRLSPLAPLEEREFQNSPVNGGYDFENVEDFPRSDNTYTQDNSIPGPRMSYTVEDDNNNTHVAHMSYATDHYDEELYDQQQLTEPTFPDPWSKLMSFTPEEAENSDILEDSEPFLQSVSAKASECSERSSRLDSHTYQTYTAGLLHSADKSEDFQILQRHFLNLEKVTEIQVKKSRPKSMDRAFLDLVDFTTEEQLEQLGKELEDFKKSKKLPVKVQKPWTPQKDKGLMRKEKTLGDIRALYDDMERTKNKPKLDQARGSDDSGKVKDILTKLEDGSACHPDIQKQNSTKSHTIAPKMEKNNQHSISPLSVTSVETSITSPNLSTIKIPQQQDSYLSNPQGPGVTSPRQPESNVISPRRTERAMYGTHIDEANNQYEIYVEEKKREYKSDVGSASLHVRCMSAPYTKPAMPIVPGARTDSPRPHLGGNPMVRSENLTEDQQFCVESPEYGLDLFTRDPVDISHGDINMPSYRDNNTDPSQDVEGAFGSAEQFSNYQPRRVGFTDQQPSSYLEEQTSPMNQDIVDGYEAGPASLQATYLTGPTPPTEEVQFKVRNLRDLAKDNEFAQGKFARGKFAQRKPLLEMYLKDVWDRSAMGELPEEWEQDNVQDTFGLIVHSHLDPRQQPVVETITTYPPLTSDLIYDLDDEDSLSSRTSSTGTFIIKMGDNAVTDLGDLSREWIPSPTPDQGHQDDSSPGKSCARSRSPENYPDNAPLNDNYSRSKSANNDHFPINDRLSQSPDNYHLVNTALNDKYSSSRSPDSRHPDDVPLNDNYTRSRSQPNLSDSFTSPLPPSSKSQSSLSSAKQKTNKFNDFALPRTISGNLKDVFKDYRDKKFTRFRIKSDEQSGSDSENVNGSPEPFQSYSPVQEMKSIQTIGNEWAQEDAKLLEQNGINQVHYNGNHHPEKGNGTPLVVNHLHPAQPQRHHVTPTSRPQNRGPYGPMPTAKHPITGY